jgi:tetratricopeptide (TPR) repeat protein
MRGFFGTARAKLAAWRRQHPALAVTGLAVLAALLGWTGYRGYRHFTARAHFRAAQEALARRDWSEGSKEAQACLRIWPDSPAAHLLAARAERRLGHPDSAAEHLDTCQRLEGGETQALRLERALLRLQQGDLAGVESFLRGCVAQDDPDAVEILDIVSLGLIRDYRLPEAHRCLDDLLRRQPDNFDMLVRHAWTARAQAWHTVAVESLQKALALRPEADGARQSLIDNLLSLGRWSEALEQVAQLRARRPDDPAVTFAEARALAGQGQKAQAIALLDRLLSDEPSNWVALGERGWLAVELDRPGEAESYLRQAHALAPPNRALLMRLSECLRLLGKHEQARLYREEAERLQKETARALQLTQRYREGGGRDADLCHELGCVLLRLGKKQDAVNFFKKALQANPRHRPTHASLAAFFAQAGNLRQAAYHKQQLAQ